MLLVDKTAEDEVVKVGNVGSVACVKEAVTLKSPVTETLNDKGPLNFAL